MEAAQDYAARVPYSTKTTAGLAGGRWDGSPRSWLRVWNGSGGGGYSSRSSSHHRPGHYVQYGTVSTRMRSECPDIIRFNRYIQVGLVGDGDGDGDGAGEGGRRMIMMR